MNDKKWIELRCDCGEFLRAFIESPESRLLSNLLAVIHGDGGHHEAEVGTEQAVADAIEKWHETRR